jgi:hypothetical protein
MLGWASSSTLIAGATLPESSGGWEHWRGTLVDSVDDLAAVDPFEVNTGDAEVRVLDMRVIWEGRQAFR